MSFEIGQALLMGARQVRKQRRALARQDRDRLGGLAFERRDRRRSERAEIVNPPGHEILHALRGTAIGDVRGVDTHGGVHSRAGEMGAGSYSGRCVLHPGLVDLRIRDELRHRVCRQVVARDQQDRLLDN